MSECRAAFGFAPEDVSPEQEAYYETVRKLVAEALEQERKKSGWRPPLPEVPTCGNRILVCGPPFVGWPPIDLFHELTIELRKCGPEFYKLCDFDRLVRICPFDPAWDAFEWRLAHSERLEALEVKVTSLERKLPTGR